MIFQNKEKPIRVKDQDDLIEFNFADLKKYHGTKSICGLTVSYKVMERGFELLADAVGEIERTKISIATAFPGPGLRDGFELVTRAYSRDRYKIVRDIEPSESMAAAARGTYYFRIDHGASSVELGLDPKEVHPDFLRLRRKQLDGVANPEELEAFRNLQFEMSNRLLQSEAKDVINEVNVNSG